MRRLDPAAPSVGSHLYTDYAAMSAAGVPESSVRRVLAEYPAEFQPQRVEDLGSAGGFSGAHFWRLTTSRGSLCLRRWPKEYPPLARLQFLQAVLWHVRQEGFGLIPLPLETRMHAGFVAEGGHFWELEPWLPGEADYWRAPSDDKLRAALRALAQFHCAAASFPLPEATAYASRGIVRRREMLARLIDGELAQIASAIAPGDWPELADRGGQIAGLFPSAQDRVARLLAEAARHPVALQPCIRDSWHDHVLFEGSQVSGLVDFGAMRPDHVATDVARLLGSLVGDDPAGWDVGLRAYAAVRPLSDAELQLVRAFDASGVLLSGVQWLRWIYLEGREFNDRTAVLARVDENLRRLRHLAR